MWYGIFHICSASAQVKQVRGRSSCLITSKLKYMLLMEEHYRCSVLVFALSQSRKMSNTAELVLCFK